MRQDKTDNITLVRNTETFTSIATHLNVLGYTYTVKVLTCQVTEANKLVSQALQLPLASQVFELRRLVIVDNVPKVLEHTYIPYSLVPGIEQIDFTNQSLYQLLRGPYKLAVANSEESILISEASEEEKELLHLKGDEVMVINGLSTDQRGIPTESYQNIAATDFFVFRSVMEE